MLQSNHQSMLEKLELLNLKEIEDRLQEKFVKLLEIEIRESEEIESVEDPDICQRLPRTTQNP